MSPNIVVKGGDRRLQFTEHPRFVIHSSLSEAAVLAAAVLPTNIRLFVFGSLGGGTQPYATCLCLSDNLYLFLRCSRYVPLVFVLVRTRHFEHV